MQSFARNLISAVQNTMLDKLLLRLFSLWWLVVLWQSQMTNDFFRVVGALFLAWLVVFGLAWLLGAIANRTDGADSPPNGFAAWSHPPEKGLRPPQPLRAIVLTLGRNGPKWLAPFTFAIFLASVALLWTLSSESAFFWPRIHPALADLSNRQLVSLGLSVLILLWSLRMWAVEQRERLVPTVPKKPGPAWVEEIGLFVVVLIIGAGLALFLGAPLWLTVIVAIVVGLTGMIWRTPLLNALFGKSGRLPERGR